MIFWIIKVKILIFELIGEKYFFVITQYVSERERERERERESWILNKFSLNKWTLEK